MGREVGGGVMRLLGFLEEALAECFAGRAMMMVYVDQIDSRATGVLTRIYSSTRDKAAERTVRESGVNSSSQFEFPTLGEYWGMVRGLTTKRGVGGWTRNLPSGE